MIKFKHSITVEFDEDSVCWIIFRLSIGDDVFECRGLKDEYEFDPSGLEPLFEKYDLTDEEIELVINRLATEYSNYDF